MCVGIVLPITVLIRLFRGNRGLWRVCKLGVLPFPMLTVFARTY